MLRSLITPYLDTRRAHHPAAPHACELPSRQRPRRLRRPSPHRPRTHFLPQATRPHSPNPHLRHWKSLQISRLLARVRTQSLQSECHRIHALAFLPNLFLKCARRFPSGSLLAASLRFHLRLFRSSLLLRQLLLGSYPRLSRLLLNRLLHRQPPSCPQCSSTSSACSWFPFL